MTDSSSSDTAELLTRMRASEPDVALQLYDRFADRIHDFVLFITRDSGMAAETTRDVIVMTAHQAAGALEDPAMLRAWLYAQARNETFALLSTRGRTPAADRVIEVPPLPAAPTTADLGGLVWTAMAAFSERDQALVTLHLRHGLSGDALADAMGLSAGAVDVLLPSTLERVEAQIDALLALATDRVPAAAPADLLEVCAEWDGMFSPLVRGRVTQMLEDCGGPAPADVPGPMSLLQTIPLVPAPASLRDAVAERLALASQMGAGVAQVDAEIDDTIPPGTPAVTTPAAGLPSTALPVVDEDTIPPGEGPPTIAGDGPPAAAPIDPTATPPPAPAPDAAPTPPGTPVAAIPLPEAAAGTPPGTPIGPPAGPAPAAPAADPPRAPARTPLPLAIALGIAVGLVVAAGLFRFFGADVAPAEPLEGADSAQTAPAAQALPSVSDPLSGAAGAALEEAVAAPTPTPTPSPTPTPGRLSVPGEEVVLNGEAMTALHLANTGGTAIDWRVAELPGWVRLDRQEGRVDPGATVEVAVTYADGLVEGDYAGAVTFAWDGEAPGEVAAPLIGAIERAPVLQGLQVGSRDLGAQGCGQEQTEIAVLVADDSPLEQVLVTAAGPGPETQTQYALAPDPQQPTRFVGVVGPFQGAGTVAVEIEATDVRGNSAATPPEVGGTLAVTGC